MTYQTPPVLFVIFSRPSTTEIVFEEIRKAKPSRLFIAADAARGDREGEHEKCLATREIVSRVDWDCEVKTLFREKHLGCGRAVSEAITWFFDHVEEGIILEDDTKPAPEFFEFCAKMLAHYRNDTRVM
ncbi:MAG TPA: nucleotide-diphospho-sugar transferase, partial [Chryseolinea sp.]